MHIVLVGLFLVSSGVGYGSERQFLMESGIFTDNSNSRLSLSTTTTSSTHPDTAYDKKPPIETINTLDTPRIFNNIITLTEKYKKVEQEKKELLCKSINLFMDEVVERIAQTPDQKNTRIDLLRKHKLNVDSTEEEIKQFLHAITTVSDITQAKLSSSQGLASSKMQFTNKAENGTYWSYDNPTDQLAYLTHISLPIEIKVHLLQLMWWSLVKKAPYEITRHSPSVINMDDDTAGERLAIYNYLINLKDEDKQSNEPKLADLTRLLPEICIENGCYYPILYNHNSQTGCIEHLNNMTTSPDFNQCDSNIKEAYAQFLITFEQWLKKSQPTEFKKIEYPNVSWKRTQEEIKKDLETHLIKISGNNYLRIANPPGKHYTFDRSKQKVYLQKLKPKIEEAKKNINHTIQLLGNNTIASINTNETIRLKKINELKEAIENLKKQRDKIPNAIKSASNDIPPVIKIIDIPAALIKNDIIDKIAALEKKIKELENPQSASSSSSSMDPDDISPELMNSSSSTEDNSTQPPVEPIETPPSEPIHPADTPEFSLTNFLHSCGTSFEDLSSEETTIPLEDQPSVEEEYNPDPSKFTLEKLQEHDQHNSSSSDDTTTTTTTTTSDEVTLQEDPVLAEREAQEQAEALDRQKIYTDVNFALTYLRSTTEIVGPISGATYFGSTPPCNANNYIDSLHTVALHINDITPAMKQSAINELIKDKHIKLLKDVQEFAYPGFEATASRYKKLQEACTILAKQGTTRKEKKGCKEFTLIPYTTILERTQIEEDLENLKYFASDEEYNNWKQRRKVAYPRHVADKKERDDLKRKLNAIFSDTITALQRKIKKLAPKATEETPGDNPISFKQNFYSTTMASKLDSIIKAKGILSALRRYVNISSHIRDFNDSKNKQFISKDKAAEIEPIIEEYNNISWISSIIKPLFESLYSLFSLSWLK